MTITIEAIYEDGVLKPTQPLPLQEREKVRITVLTGASVAEQSFGLMGWAGAGETVQRFALDPEFDPLEAP